MYPLFKIFFVSNWRPKLQISERIWMKYLKNEKFFGELNEHALSSFYSSWVKEGDMVIDGGANIGRHTQKLSQIVKDSGLVIAIEPIPHLAQSLRTIENVEVKESALGRAVGVQKFQHIPSLEGWSGLKKRSDLPDNHNVNELEVSTMPLDTLIYAPDKRVTFIKLDLEGGEFDALFGGCSLLLESRAIVAFENSLNYSADLYNYSEKDFFDFFDRVNYGLMDFFGNYVTSFDFDRNQPQPWQFLAFPMELDHKGLRRRLRRSCWSATFTLTKELVTMLK